MRERLSLRVPERLKPQFGSPVGGPLAPSGRRGACSRALLSATPASFARVHARLREGDSRPRVATPSAWVAQVSSGVLGRRNRAGTGLRNSRRAARAPTTSSAEPVSSTSLRPLTNAVLTGSTRSRRPATARVPAELTPAPRAWESSSCRSRERVLDAILQEGSERRDPNGHASSMASAAQCDPRIGQLTREALVDQEGAGCDPGRPGPIPERSPPGRLDAAGRMTLQAIRDTLNAEQVPTPRGGRLWRPTSLRAVLAG
jgi:hypothetical protein